MFFKLDWLVFFQVIKIESQPADEARWDFSYVHSEISDTVVIIIFLGTIATNSKVAYTLHQGGLICSVSVWYTGVGAV